ncbi:MAG: TetR family transcriptional regulator [Hyphomicrobiales bacterium]|nr:TetR family transcriptional regulator [Hyphomicrobiales bacterium]
MSTEQKPRRYVSAARDAAVEQVRARVLESAFAVLQEAEAEKSFSLDAVAKRAGVTRLTVHNQFGTRRQLLEAVFDDRARQGGLHRIAEAMALPDPVAGVDALITTFCSFWSHNHLGLHRLIAVASMETDFARALRERNERRRHVLSVLAGRMSDQGTIRADAAADLVDVLFAMTGMTFFADLQRAGRDAPAVEALIRDLAHDSIARARKPRSTGH